MNESLYNTIVYENKSNRTLGENKPISNPIQTQLKPNQSQIKPNSNPTSRKAKNERKYLFYKGI